MGCIYRAGIYRAKNCKNHFKNVGQIILKKKMTLQLMWRNVRAAVLNAMLRLLVIYRYRLLKNPKKEMQLVMSLPLNISYK